MEILHLSDSFIVVNKPPGIASVPGGWHSDSPASNLVDLLTPEYGKIWIVHRLDKGTSGAILFARNADSHRLLSILFASHLAHKVYHALVCGIPTWQEHVARHHLRMNSGHSHRTVVDNARGVTAVTRFEVLEKFTGHALLQAVPETGRTHQVRAHAAALGYPLLGDDLYGAPRDKVLDRPALHACSLAFEFDGKSFSFNAPYPQDFQDALTTLRRLT